MILEELAAAISDGKPVDWALAESSATSEAEREAVLRFHTISQLAQFHATFHSSVHSSQLHDSILHPADEALAGSGAVDHAGAIVMGRRGTYRSKKEALEDAGATVLATPSDVGEALKERLAA